MDNLEKRLANTERALLGIYTLVSELLPTLYQEGATQFMMDYHEANDGLGGKFDLPFDKNEQAMTNFSMKNMWWGYLHANGSVQVKRWFGDIADYTTDCDGNPFVIEVVAPFEAKTREDALSFIRKRLGVNPSTKQKE